ncbi:MAG: aminotransferase class I/II-fold pyridoxal phosphate-dependent enzyme [Rikenellaceae bacterium]|jgi:aspartate/methionine/tyrosine aminotransferase|nr:aminotransferase class I/II-fold pyridoxal phosphate-dependent enzyme [Rikenellaceae bacterium]MBQ5372244.1 aminotransferase class I/II-fold pyridoxal phosphate-dependent enzyme [Rikenellaceae bacterium]MBQ5595685.1 aminotransferase class I/II-fold pyridoxal phosphate-dependent enzyme [Rikenellaceae bacterium]
MNKVTIERSHRLDGIGEYYFSRKLREISEIEAATGRQIIRLAMGSPDLPPHQSVIDRLAKEAQRPDVHKYMSYQGEPILRKAFADWYKRYYNVDVDFKSEVLPLLGSKEGLMHICQTFLNVGDKVLVPNPGYPTYSAAVKLSGGVMVPYSLNKQTGFLPDFEAIEAAGLEGVKMMLVNYPNMPTGQTPTPELFEKLVEFGAKHNILIIHDNPYSFVRNPQPMSILQVEGAMEVAMELNSLSKGHSMAGWRVGAIFAKKEWIDAILCFKSNMDSGMFYPVQAAAETALSLGDEWFKELNDIYYAREKQGYELLDALGCTYRKGQAGLFIWAELPESYEGDSFQFSDEVMEKCDVFVTPGAIFGSEGKRYVRITLCCPAELLEKAAQRVRERLNK